MKRNLLIALALLAVLFLAGWTMQKPQYEYKVEYNANEKKINSLASQGYELVAIGSESSGTIIIAAYVFRRAK